MRECELILLNVDIPVISALNFTLLLIIMVYTVFDLATVFGNIFPKINNASSHPPIHLLRVHAGTRRPSNSCVHAGTRRPSNPCVHAGTRRPSNPCVHAGTRRPSSTMGARTASVLKPPKPLTPNPELSNPCACSDQASLVGNGCQDYVCC